MTFTSLVRYHVAETAQSAIQTVAQRYSPAEVSRLAFPFRRPNLRDSYICDDLDEAVTWILSLLTTTHLDTGLRSKLCGNRVLRPSRVALRIKEDTVRLRLASRHDAAREKNSLACIPLYHHMSRVLYMYGLSPKGFQWVTMAQSPVLNAMGV